MKALGKNDIAAIDDNQVLAVAVPEWSKNGEECGVYVRIMTAAERDSFEAGINVGNGERNLNNLRARLCVLCVVDEKGNRLFRGEADTKMLGEKSSKAINRIFDAARKHNGMTEGDVEELEKNSLSSQDANSSSP